MSNLDIKKGDFETLTQVAESVPLGEDVTELIDSMRELMMAHKGCGLAANQVGVLKRVILINTPKFVGEIINPVLTDGKFIKQSKEGCLSFPDRQRTMGRFNRITVSGFDRNWNPITKRLKSLSAFCAQHEVDHLNGITILT